MTEAEKISLLESLGGEWIALPLTVMRDAGPAVQTLGGLLKITNRETYVAVSEIAGTARLPTATVRKHLVMLDSRGWIASSGRQKTRRGALRRTATTRIAKQTLDHLKPYGILPWWACCSIRKVGRLPWSAKAVFSIVMARLCSLKGAAERDGVDEDAEEMIAKMGGDDRFEFSLDWLTEQTGLHRETIVRAKRFLNHRYGMVRWIGTPVEAGTDTPTHQLVPNWDFRVVVTPAQKGGVYLAFERGSDSGQ